MGDEAVMREVGQGAGSPAVSTGEPAGTIASLVAERARVIGGEVALAAPGREPLTYAALAEQLASTAGALRELGIEPGQRVAVVLGNGPELATAFLAITAAASCAPLNPAYRPHELDFYLADLDARALVVAAGESGPAREAAERRGIPVVEIVVSPRDAAGAFALAGAPSGPPPGAPPGNDDVALVLHTSGTTSRPKLVPLTHRNLLASARNVARTLELSPDDRCLNVMPLFHIHGLVAGLLAPLHADGSVVCPPPFRADRFFGWWEELEPTWYTAVPTMHQAVLSRAAGAADAIARHPIRFARSSSSALAPQVFEQLEQTLAAPVVEAYGMTEAAHQMASNPLPPGERKPGSVGLPAGPEVTVLDAAGAPLPPGAVGEIAIRGENVFAGYEGNPDANRLAFVGGWFRTGDEGCVDADGYLILRGRLKEIINRGGEKISPREVDEALLDHPAVEQAVTFSIPDDLLGEDVGAAVVLHPGSAVEQAGLQRFVAERLADFKVPRKIVVLDELPRGGTGKVQRIGLAERLGVTASSAGGEAGFVAPRTGTEREVAELFARILGVEHVGVHDEFFALGGDSVAAAELVAEVCARGLAPPDLPAASVLWAPTVEAFAGLLDAGAVTGPTSRLVPLEARGTGAPLFLAHTHEGHALGYVELVRAMGAGRPVYALEALGLEGREPPRERIEEMAADYVREVREVRPDGPYFLGGHCMGAMIALEMAAQLTAAGAEVGLVLLVDPIDGELGASERVRHRLVRHRERAVVHARRGDLGAWAVRKLTGRRAPVAEEAGRRPPPVDPARQRFLDAMSAVRDRYVPSRYPGRIVVLRTIGTAAPCSHWRRLAADVRCETIASTSSPGERAAVIAERFGALLDAAERERAQPGSAVPASPFA